MPNIDLHHHIYIPEAEALAAKERESRPQHADSFEGFFPPESSRYNAKMTEENWAVQLADAERKLSDMKADRLDMALASPPPPTFYYWIGGAAGDEIIRVQNDGVVDFCNQNAAHFRGLCNLPMQNGGEAAAAELERAMGKGLLGCIISDHIGTHALDEPQYEEFWAAAERLGALVFIHPDFADYKPLFPYYMANCIGNPLSTTIAATRLIFSGHFERYPNLQLPARPRGRKPPLGDRPHPALLGGAARNQGAHAASAPALFQKPIFRRHHLQPLRSQVDGRGGGCGSRRLRHGLPLRHDAAARVVDFVEGAGLTEEAQEKILRETPAKIMKI